MAVGTEKSAHAIAKLVSLLGLVVLGLASRAEVCIKKDLIVWPSASRKVLGILLSYFSSSY